MVDVMRLDSAIAESGLKYCYIAEKMGISRQSLRHKVNGDSDFSCAEATKLCEIIGLDDVETRHRIFFAHEVETHVNK